MMYLIHCDQCHKDGLFDIHLEFEYQRRNCKNCWHTEQDKWQYWFCNLGCLFAWLKENKVEEEGMPCRACVDGRTGKSTGFHCGFESNGTCNICDGIKRVKIRKDTDNDKSKKVKGKGKSSPSSRPGA